MVISFRSQIISLIGWSKRELLRVFRLWNQTIVGPFVEGFMMIVLFAIFISSNIKGQSSVDIPMVINGLWGGVIGMTITRNAFAATSTPLVIAKMIGYETDYTALPFALFNLRIGPVIAGFVRCTAITICFVCCTVLLKIEIHHIFMMIFCVILSSIIFGLIGIAVGSLCSTFEQLSTINGYVIMPLSMLSGTFVPIDQFPEIFQKITLFNPFFYSVDLMRYCFTNYTVLNIRNEILYFVIFIPIAWIISGLFVKSFIRSK